MGWPLRCDECGPIETPALIRSDRLDGSCCQSFSALLPSTQPIAELRFHQVCPDPTNAEKITDWCKSYWDALHPYSSGGAYSNFMMDEGQERVKASYKHNYDRLAKIKAKYDVNNFFSVNQNIKPAN